MKRSEFMKLLAAGTAGALFGENIIPFENKIKAWADSEPDLIIVKGSSPERMIVEAMNGYGGMKRFISRNDRVLVKPNIGFDRAPNLAATTNPGLIAAIVRLCIEAGAKEVRVLDRTANEPRRCYSTSGIAEAAKGAGAVVMYTKDEKVKECKINGNVLTRWPVLIDALEVDKIINVPIAKVHSLTGLTLGMKNWFGVIGGERAQLHQEIHQVIPELSSIFTPALVVLDATRILTRNGPTGGDESFVKRLDTIIVGQDQVAVDAYGATLFDRKPEEFGFIANGHKMGLGQMRLEALNIKTIALS